MSDGTYRFFAVEYGERAGKCDWICPKRSWLEFSVICAIPLASKLLAPQY